MEKGRSTMLFGKSSACVIDVECYGRKICRCGRDEWDNCSFATDTDYQITGGEVQCCAYWEPIENECKNPDAIWFSMQEEKEVESLRQQREEGKIILADEMNKILKGLSCER